MTVDPVTLDPARLAEEKGPATPQGRKPVATAAGNEPPARDQRRLHFELAFGTERIERLSCGGQVDFASGRWQVGLEGTGVVLDDVYLQLLPAAIASRLGTLRSFAGELDFAGEAAGDLSWEQTPRFTVGGKLREGHLNDTRLPYALEEVRAAFELSNREFRVSQVSAAFGTGRVQVECAGGWLTPGEQPLALRLIGQRVTLDESIARAVPPSLRKLWDDYQPSGPVNFDCRLTKRDGRWVQDVQLELLDVSAQPRAFPYRVEGCQGLITWQQGHFTIDCKALASGRVVSIQGEVWDDPHAPSEIRILSPKPVPLDEKLMQALERYPNLHRTVREFHVTGRFTCEAIIRRHPLHRKMALDFLQLQVRDASMEYEQVPYPVSGLRGEIIFENGITRLKNVRGQNDGGTLLLEGQVDQAGGLELNIIGDSVPMEEELRLALPVSLQQVWLNLRPRGTLDHVQVRVWKESRDAEMSFDVRVQKFKRRGGLMQSLSIQPVWFPQRLDDLSGTLVYRDGQLTIRELEAYAGTALVSAAGHGQVTSSGWRTVFENLAIDSLIIDEPFLEAMPKQLRMALKTLDPQGDIHLFGKLVLTAGQFEEPSQGLGQVWGSDQETRQLPLGGLGLERIEPHSATPVLTWDMQVDMDDGSLNLGRRVEHIYGGLRLRGRQDETGTLQIGEIDVDSLVFEGMQFTAVRGPIRIDEEEVAVGRWAEIAKGQQAPRPVIARLFGGQVLFDARVLLEEETPFVLQTSLSDGDLKLASRALTPQLDDVSGIAHGWLQLRGTALGTETFQGNGFLRLRDARIYEIPVMLSLLKTLSLKQPDSTAFNTGNLDFLIGNEHFTFERLEFLGDAISLKGNGEMDFNGGIDLLFYSMVGRDERKIPVLSPLLGSASQNFWLIEVDGTIKEPRPKQRPFPALNETLQQIFPEVINEEAALAPR